MKGPTVIPLEGQAITEQNALYNNEASKSHLFNYIDLNLLKNYNTNIENSFYFSKNTIDNIYLCDSGLNLDHNVYSENNEKVARWYSVLNKDLS